MAIFKPGDYVKCNRTGVEGFLEVNTESPTYTLSLANNTYTTSGKYSTRDMSPCLEHSIPQPALVEITKLTTDKHLIYFKELNIYVYDSPNGVIQLAKEQIL